MRIQHISFKANQEIAPYCFANIQVSAILHKGDDEQSCADKLKDFACNNLSSFKDKVNNLKQINDDTKNDDVPY